MSCSNCKRECAYAGKRFVRRPVCGTTDHLHATIVGQKNCGKSALFNILTGSKTHVGNYPGVTTQVQTGEVKSDYTQHAKALGNRWIEVADMAGLYSLTPYSHEEEVTLEALLSDEADLLIDVVDACDLERSLYLTLQLLELDTPLIIALNRIDELQENDIAINIAELQDALKVPVIPISATKGRGITELVDAVVSESLAPYKRPYVDYCKGDLHRALHSISHIIEDHSEGHNLPSRYAATRLVMHDDDVKKMLNMHKTDAEVISQLIDTLEEKCGVDGESALATARYEYADKLAYKALKHHRPTKEQLRSDKIDALLTHRVFGIPIFIGIMALVFWLTFAVIGGPLQQLLEQGFDLLMSATGDAILGAGISYWVYDLLVNGVMNGIFSVLSFLPIIMTLFFFLSILEDSGYMTRVAYLMDTGLKKFGLSGRSFAPLIIGFGCNVPAILSTRSLPSERDRKLTILLIPFMSCSAKLPVYGMITAAFFGASGALVMTSLYLLGVVVALIVCLILSKTLFKGDAMMYLTDLPAYRFPALTDVLRHMWENAAEFVKKVFTVIFLGTIIIWFLQNFDLSFQIAATSSDSILAWIGGQIAVIFVPLGFGTWQAATSLLAGLAAKEAVVSTLAILLQSGSDVALSANLQTLFTPLSAYCFLVFILLYVPCIATFACMRKEFGSIAKAFGAVVMQICIAYVVTFIIYQTGSLIAMLC